MLSHGPVGLFGKLPSQGDFLRVNLASPAAHGLARWLQEGVEAAHLAGARLPPQQVGFLFQLPDTQPALVGAFVPSQDRVGRFFPAAVFVPVQGSDLAARFPVFPRAYRPFLDAAGALLAEGSGLDGAALAGRLRSLPLPSDADVGSAERALRDAARAGRAVDLEERLFGDRSQGQQYYGFRTFQTACAPARGKRAATGGATLDCPVSGELDAWAWAELARRTLRWPAPPSLVWRGDPAPRLLVSLGPIPAAAFASLCEPQRDSNRIWPLRTTQAAAVAAARGALGPTLAAIERPDATVEDLIASLSA